MYSDEEVRAGLRPELEVMINGRKVGERPADMPRMPRLIKTTFYEFGKNPCKETEVKVTHSVYADYAGRSAWYALSQNKYEAGVVEIIDTGNFDELCAILTRDVQGNIQTIFKRDPKHPKLTTGN